MTLNPLSGLWARTALLWFLGTISFGMYIGFSQQFHLSTPHAHIGLLGWISSALFAFLHAITGGAALGARIHWAAHNSGVVLLAIGMFMTVQYSESGWTPLIPLGGGIVLLATLWLATTLWPKLGER